MAGLCREGLDQNIGHASSYPNPFHQGSYKSTLNTKVFIEGSLAIVEGDTMRGCKDLAVGCSTKVFACGKGVHRIGDATSGHTHGGSGYFPPNAAQSGSGKVFAA